MQVASVVDYTWSEYDRIDLLAGQVFGDETMWWVIAQVNPEIMTWDDIPPGTVVRVPSGS